MGMIILQPFHWRLAELAQVMQKRRLNDEEAVEMHHCLTSHIKYCWDVATLEETSLLASQTNDSEWQHEICEKLDRVMYGKPKTKKPGSKKRPDQK